MGKQKAVWSSAARPTARTRHSRPPFAPVHLFPPADLRAPFWGASAFDNEVAHQRLSSLLNSPCSLNQLGNTSLERFPEMVHWIEHFLLRL